MSSKDFRKRDDVSEGQEKNAVGFEWEREIEDGH